MKNPLLKGVFSNRSDDWATPDVIYKYLYKRYGVSKSDWFDPCPLGAVEQGYNGLEEDWGSEFIYINPPYSNIKDFVSKAIEFHKQAGDGTISELPTIIFLIPARTDTQYYKHLFTYGAEFEFIEGRLKFSNSKYSSTFPSVLVRITGGGQPQIKYLTKDILNEGSER